MKFYKIFKCKILLELIQSLNWYMKIKPLDLPFWFLNAMDIILKFPKDTMSYMI